MHFGISFSDELAVGRSPRFSTNVEQSRKQWVRNALEGKGGEVMMLPF